MDVKRIMVIVNPQAGLGKGQKCLREIEEWKDKIFKQKGIEVDIELSQKSGKSNATNLAKEAFEGRYNLIIVIGGDGTINEVVNGLVGLPIPVGFVQAGSGNDFARALKIPQDLKKALKVAIQGKLKTVDLGKVNDRVFVNVFGVGFDARVAQYAENLKKRWHVLPNTFLYLIALLRELLFKLKYPNLEVKISQEKNLFRDIGGKVTLVSVANGPTCGGIFRLAPQADLRDGFLDICLVKKASRMRILINIFRAIKGTHLELPEVRKNSDGKLPKAKSLIISSLENQNLICQMDGEILPPEKEYRITVLPKALKVIVP